jgi:hypothetical protein
MGRRIIKQPNHLYAFFSDVVNDFTAMNLTMETVLDRLTAVVGLEEAKGNLNTANSELDSNGRPQKPLFRWEEALDKIVGIHGPELGLTRSAAGEHAHLPIDVARNSFFDWTGPEHVRGSELKYTGTGGPFTVELFIYQFFNRQKFGYRGIAFFRSGELESREEFLSDVPFDVASAANKWAHEKARAETKRLWSIMVLIDADDPGITREILMQKIVEIDEAQGEAQGE